MADVIQLSDGTTTIDLYYDITGFEMKADGNDFGVAGHDNTMHAPIDRDGEIVVRHRLENIEWPLALRVLGTDNDGVNDNINALGRLAEQGRRYETNGDVDKVYLSIQMDGCSNWTRFDVKDILYDEIAAFNFYNIRADELTHDAGFSIEVITHPTGYGDSMYLRNVLYTPGFGEDSNSDGLANHWDKYNGSETTSFNTTNYLVGFRSQQISVGSLGNRGIESDNSVGHTGVYWGEPFVAYAWVYRVSGGDDIRMDVNGNNTGLRGTALYSTSTITTTDSDGQTWRKLEVSGTIGGNDGYMTMTVFRTNASEATVFCVDKTYIQIATTVMPTSEWTGCCLITNHYESDAEGIIPYLDIDGIRGDRPTYPEIWIRNYTSVSGNLVEFIKITNSASKDINQLDYYLQMGGNVNLNKSNDDYASVSVDGSEWTSAGSELTISPIEPWVGEVLVMAAIYNTSAEDVYVRGNFRYASEDYQDNFSEVVYSVQDQWRLVTAGPVIVPSLGYSTSTALARLEFKLVDEDASAVDIYIDFILFAPIDDGSAIFQLPDTIENCGGLVLVDNERRQVLTATATLDIDAWKESIAVTGRALTGFLGREIRLIPNRANKMFFMCTRTDPLYSEQQNLHVASVGEPVTVAIEYKPRTRFLLGDS